MLLRAPKGATSVSVDGQEYKVKNRLLEVPDHLGAELFPHGFNVEIPEEEPETPPEDPPKTPDDPPKTPEEPPKTPADPPKATDDKKKSEPSTPPEEKTKNDAAAGGDKNGK